MLFCLYVVCIYTQNDTKIKRKKGKHQIEAKQMIRFFKKLPTNNGFSRDIISPVY